MQLPELRVEPGVERQLAVDDERRDEHDPCAAVGGEPAREIERVLRLLPREKRHDDRPIRDGLRPARQPPRAAIDGADVGQLHLTSG